MFAELVIICCSTAVRHKLVQEVGLHALNVVVCVLGKADAQRDLLAWKNRHLLQCLRRSALMNLKIWHTSQKKLTSLVSGSRVQRQQASGHSRAESYAANSRCSPAQSRCCCAFAGSC